jgi:serine/threonine protein phosphatase PrpC
MNGDCPRQLDVYPWTVSLKEQGLNYTEISYVFLKDILNQHLTCCSIFRSLDAIYQTFDLEFDDIIILSTDGLFDNVPDHLIEQILSHVSFTI